MTTLKSSLRISMASITLLCLTAALVSSCGGVKKSDLIGTWESSPGSKTWQFWDDGTFVCADDHGCTGGIWDSDKGNLILELLARKPLGGQWKKGLVEYQEFYVSGSAADNLQVKGLGTLRRSNTESMNKPTRLVNWPAKPRPQPPIFSSVIRQDVAAVKELLEHQLELASSKDDNGCTPLIHAVNPVHANLEILKVLLEKGSDANADDGNGKPVLVCALEFSGWWLTMRNSEMAHGVVRLLIEHGANVNPDSKYLPLPACLEHSDIYNLELLLKKGADPNLKDENGTWLIQKVARGSQVFLLLKKYGANEPGAE